ncbi:MAG: hypothetical protein LUE63_08510 [Lachnospiraceae bacterium]|nr:hypothetical protein [Lachnospiraceae bacterium]
MMDNMLIQAEGIRELERLIQWITENQEKWLYICDPEYFELSVEKRHELIQSLEDAGLYTAAYIVFWSAGGKSPELENIRIRLVNEVIAKLPTEQIIKTIEKNMEKRPQL